MVDSQLLTDIAILFFVYCFSLLAISYACPLCFVAEAIDHCKMSLSPFIS